MKYKPKFIKDVTNVCGKLRHEFFVNEYHMEIEFHKEDEKDKDTNLLAKIPIDSKYLTFTVCVYPALQKEWDKSRSDCLETLIHEFSHLLTEPLYDIAVTAVSTREAEYLEEVRERQTQRITNIIFPYLKKKL